jgi:O-antigen ligase
MENSFFRRKEKGNLPLTSQHKTNITSQTPGKTLSITNSLLSFCFILFVLASPFSISITQVAAFFGVVIWLVQTHLTNSWNKTRLTLVWPIGLFFLAGVLSTATAIDPKLSLLGLKKLLKAAVFFWAMNALASVHPMDFLTQIAQRLKLTKIQNHIETRTKLLKSINPLSFLIDILIATGALAAAYGIFQGLTDLEGIWHRHGVHGSLSNLMTYSIILLLISSLVLSRILFDPRSSKKFLLGALGLLGAAMVLTLLRQVWLGFFVAIIFLFFIKKRVLILVPFVTVGLVLLFGPHAIGDRLKSITDFNQHSNQERIMLWHAGWDIFNDYPLTGCGFNCLYIVEDQYSNHPILKKYHHVHNNILQIVVDTGIIGLCAWIFIWVAYFIQLRRQYQKKGPDAPERWVVLASSASVIAFLISGMFENSFYDSEIIILLYFIMALPFVQSNNPKPASSNPVSSSIP